MKKNFWISLRLTAFTVVVFGFLYPVLVTGVGKLVHGGGSGVVLEDHGKVIGFELVGQRFVSTKYFHGRPSAVDYNAAATGGSNKGPTNPEYLAAVHERVDAILKENPTITVERIPVDLVTASGGGLDPDISPAAARAQVDRVAKARGLDPTRVKELVDQQIQPPLWGLFGTSTVNVLKLNLALDSLSAL